MMVIGCISVHAERKTYHRSVGGCVVQYAAECSDSVGYADTWITSGSASYSRLYSEVTLYALNNETGSVIEYGSEYMIDQDYCEAAVYITTSGYQGHYVSTEHSAYVVGVSGTEGTDEYSYARVNN